MNLSDAALLAASHFNELPEPYQLRYWHSRLVLLGLRGHILVKEKEVDEESLRQWLKRYKERRQLTIYLDADLYERVMAIEKGERSNWINEKMREAVR